MFRRSTPALEIQRQKGLRGRKGDPYLTNSLQGVVDCSLLAGSLCRGPGYRAGMRSWGLHIPAALVVSLALVVGSSAQTVPVNITQFSVTSPTITYGQNQSYGAVVTSNPLFPGPFLWQNGSQTIATLSSLSNATSQGVFLGGAGFTYLAKNVIGVGTYSKVHAVFPGATQGTTTWTAADSVTTPLPYASFVVTPAGTGLTLSYTPFTLSNFTDSILLNVTNTAATGVAPQGPVYEYITNKDGTVVGNYSLDLTVLDANTVQGKLPSSFDAESLLTDGSYTAVYTYYPTPNFTQPAPLTITFDITGGTPSPSPGPPSPTPSPAPVPSPPPRPAPPPPSPPAPLAGNGSTTLVLEIYYNQARNWLKQCSGTTVMLWAVVGATQVTSPPQGPKDGVIIFKNAMGAILGEGPVQAVSVGHVGFSVTLDAKSSAVGLVAVTATYTGSTNGVWLPSSASASFTVPTGCTASDGAWKSLQADDAVAQQYAQGIAGSLVGGAPGSSIYSFGNNQGNVYGYPQGAYSTPGSSDVGTDGNMGNGQGSSG
ncbi:g6569 [Coccomyxa viridis]|uniref:G6569 protein n=1 Tax=Coccomyxa viridis TaxID=1274662 RepID=A0ABP1G0J1_9CHLO